MSRRSERRSILAAVLSVIQPGVGHLYLREWIRAGLWAGLWAGSLALILVTSGIDVTPVELLAAVAGLFAAVEGFPPEAIVSIFAVTLFTTLDAYWIAARDDRQRSDSECCPHCGKTRDPTLEFCHWCTAVIDQTDETP